MTESARSYRSLWRIAAGSVACGLTAAFLVTPVNAEDINQQVSQASDDLARADAKVAASLDRLDAAQSKLPQARQRLAKAQNELVQAQERKAAADKKVAEAMAKVARAKAEIAKTEQQIAYLENQIGRMARDVYQNGGSASEMEILLNSSDPGDFASRLQALRSIAEGNNDALSELDAAKAQLAIRLESLKKLEDEAEEAQNEAQKQVQVAADAKAEADAAKAEIDRLVGERAAALRDARSRRASVKKKYDQYKAEQARIAAIARAAAQKASGGGGVPANIGSGGLMWPTPGASVGGNVGPRIHPVYGYRSCHTGADISAGAGTPIHAAASGVVVSVENGGPYGLHTLIQHGSGISTMYAHQSSASVSAGQRVSRGQVIGNVGSTGWSTGPHLHFEVHVNGTPYDPMGWFGGSKVPVRC